MTKPGDTFAFPDGTEWLVEVAPDDVDGTLVFVVTLPPGGLAPPPHRHPRAVETFEGLEGTLSLKIHGTWHDLGPGQRATVSPGTSHTLANRGKTPVKIRNAHAPACGFDDFVAHVEALTRARGITKGSDIRVPVLMSMLTLEYPDTLVPGRAVDAVLTRILASIGRGLGMSTRPAMD